MPRILVRRVLTVLCAHADRFRNRGKYVEFADGQRAIRQSPGWLTKALRKLIRRREAHVNLPDATFLIAFVRSERKRGFVRKPGAPALKGRTA